MTEPGVTPEEEPLGELTVRTIAMPADTNANGDIFGGWVMSRMDQAGGIAGVDRAQGARGHGRGRGDDVHPAGQDRRRAQRLHACRSGRPDLDEDPCRGLGAAFPHAAAREGHRRDFTFVAIDEEGRPRPVPKLPEA